MSARDPWMKFYPSDWRSDPRLRMCGLAARGLWIEMLALMHEADPYGHLLVSGIAPTDAQLGVLVGAPSDQVPELLGELETAGVFSRTRAGVIYSRRMTRDEKKRQTARRNGKTGGNPTLGKNKGNPTPDNPKDKGGLKTQKPEARGQIPEEDTAGAASSQPAELREPDRPSEDPAFLDRIRQAANASDRGDWLADPLLAMHVVRWRDLGLSDDEMLAVTASRSRGRQIGSPSYLDGPMQDAAGRKGSSLKPTADGRPPPATSTESYTDRLARLDAESEARVRKRA